MMTRISNRRLLPKIQNRMLYVFWKVLSELKSPRQLEFLTNDLFSPVERIMIAKRLLIAVLLLQGQTFRRIEGLLKVSPNTVASTAGKVGRRGSGYRQTFQSVINHPEVKKLLKIFV